MGVSATGFLGLVLHFLHVAIDEAANLNWVDLPSLAVADLKYKKMQISRLDSGCSGFPLISY